MYVVQHQTARSDADADEPCTFVCHEACFRRLCAERKMPHVCLHHAGEAAMRGAPVRSCASFPISRALGGILLDHTTVTCGKCGLASVPAGGLEKHLRADCPKAEITCPVVSDCPVHNLPREQAAEHARTHAEQHLALALARIETFRAAGDVDAAVRHYDSTVRPTLFRRTGGPGSALLPPAPLGDPQLLTGALRAAHVPAALRLLEYSAAVACYVADRPRGAGRAGASVSQLRSRLPSRHDEERLHEILRRALTSVRPASVAPPPPALAKEAAVVFALMQCAAGVYVPPGSRVQEELMVGIGLAHPEVGESDEFRTAEQAADAMRTVTLLRHAHQQVAKSAITLREAKGTREIIRASVSHAAYTRLMEDLPCFHYTRRQLTDILSAAEARLSAAEPASFRDLEGAMRVFLAARMDGSPCGPAAAEDDSFQRHFFFRMSERERDDEEEDEEEEDQIAAVDRGIEEEVSQQLEHLSPQEKHSDESSEAETVVDFEAEAAEQLAALGA